MGIGCPSVIGNIYPLTSVKNCLLVAMLMAVVVVAIAVEVIVTAISCMSHGNSCRSHGDINRSQCGSCNLYEIS